MRQKIKELIAAAYRKLLAEPPPEFEVERPKVKAHGDLASNIALVAARVTGRPTRDLAASLAAELKQLPILEKIEIAGGGFLNLTLRAAAWQESLREIDAAGDRWGRSDVGRGKRVLVEFVSANPTGPVHIGNARGGPLGDALASLLEASGFEVVREYYVNDVGGQIAKLGQSLMHWISPDKFPELGYQGEYVRELAERARNELKPEFAGSNPEALAEKLGSFAIDQMMKEVRDDCTKMGIRFDSWIREKELLASGETGRTIEELRKRGVVVEKEGALWLATQDEFLQDRECVLVKSDGQPTYFANDVAYHAGKFRRGFDRLIDIWGSNHHGHVPRMKSALASLGFDPDRFEVVLYQYVRVKRGAEAVKMSKRGGNFVTAREVLDEVGPDPFRFFLLMRAPESHLDFDLELAKRHSQENPVYYVQYAHARLASLFRKAAESGLAEGGPRATVALSRLTLPEEIDLIRLLHEFPDEVRRAAERLEPHRIPFYLLELTKLFQSYYTRAKEDPRYRVLGGDIDTTGAKLYLAKILQRTIANGLKLIGVSAPEVMENE